jgi:hypothetical protein
MTKETFIYNDHRKILELLAVDQDAEQDNREKVKEIELFLNKRNGQYEGDTAANVSNRPRYTFDRCNPVVDGISGQIERSAFNICVKMAGGQATKETAAIYDGIIRNINNISKGDRIRNMAARRVVASGLSGWEIKQKELDPTSLEQDLVITPIHNYGERVWFDSGAFEPDMSDANHCFVLSALTSGAAERFFPKIDRELISIQTLGTQEVYFNKPDTAVIGRILYKKPIRKTLLLFNNGMVVDKDESDIESVLDEYEAIGITVEQEVKKDIPVVYQRWFDNDGWLNKAEETVFNTIPIVPVFANFSVIENKLIYWGAVEKLLDQQRILNYVYSRIVEMQVSSSREKIWMTQAQAAGHEETLETMNINSDPVQFYNHVMDQPQPYKVPGPQVDQSLLNIAVFAAESLDSASSYYKSGKGEAVRGDQSGVAIEKLQDRTDTAAYKYFTAIKTAQERTAEILIQAIPKVYTPKRIVRLLGDDGTEEVKQLNETIIDQQTGQTVEINDLTQGKYDCVCVISDSYKNRQEKTVKYIQEIGKVDPRVIQMGADILLKNIEAPGMDAIAARLRRISLMQGIIPDDQMTDEEKAAMQQKIAQEQQQGGQPDAAQALIIQAQAELQKAQTAAAELMSKAEERAARLQLDASKQQQDFELQQQKIQADLAKAEAQSEFRFAQLDSQNKKQFEEIRKIQAEIMLILKNVMGADGVLTPAAPAAIQSTAVRLTQ